MSSLATALSALLTRGKAYQLTAVRAIDYARFTALLLVPLIVLMLALELAGVRLGTAPAGNDFTSFWTVARLAIQAGPERAYDIGLQQAAQGGQDFYIFLYPPTFLALVMPFGFLPFGVALGAWVASTSLGYWLMARRLHPYAYWPTAALPAAFVNAVNGQNGALTAALFCGAAESIERRPFVAGLLLGCFIIKPHLALLFPIAMLAGRQWAVIAGAAVSALIAIVGSFSLLGSGAWLSFLHNGGIAWQVLEQEGQLWPKMTSLFAALAMGGASIPAAYAAQATMTLGVTVLTGIVWSRPGDPTGKMAVLAVAAVLATPFVYDYDLVMLVVPLCWIASDRKRTALHGWEKALLLSAYLLPFFHRGVSAGLGINLAWLILLLLALIVARRCMSGLPTGFRLYRHSGFPYCVMSDS